MKIRIPYLLKYGNPIHQKTEDNITSINNKKEKEEDKINLQEDFKKIIEFYENNITLITPFVAEDIDKYLKQGVKAELIIEIMKEAVSRNKRNLRYIASILNSCIDNNIKTAKQFRISQEEFKSNKKTPQQAKAKEKVEYEEVEMTEEEYRKKLYEVDKNE